MKVIDKILNEWSFRCHDGIVDLNDLKKVKILFEILKEDIDDDILNALINTDSDVKAKVLKQLKRIGKDTDSDLIKLLKSKNLKDLYKNVLFEARALGQEDELLEYLKSDSQITLNDLIEKNNSTLYDLFVPTPLSEEFIESLTNISGAAGNVGIGRGEVALIVLLKDAKKAGKGDINVSEKIVEIKNRSGKTGAILVPKSVSNFSSDEINELLTGLINSIFADDSFKKELIKSKELQKNQKGSWASKVNIIYKNYLIQKENGKTNSNFETELNKIFKAMYGDLAPNANDYLEDQDFNIIKFKINIAKILAKSYFDYSPFDYILFLNPSFKYSIYEKDLFIEDIGTTIEISGLSDSLPRLSI